VIFFVWGISLDVWGIELICFGGIEATGCLPLSRYLFMRYIRDLIYLIWFNMVGTGIGCTCTCTSSK